MINSTLGVCGQYIKICQKVTKTLLTFTLKWFITNHYRAQETSHTISLLQGLVLSSLLKRSFLDNTQRTALYVRKINVINIFFVIKSFCFVFKSFIPVCTFWYRSCSLLRNLSFVKFIKFKSLLMPSPTPLTRCT